MEKMMRENRNTEGMEVTVEAIAQSMHHTVEAS